MGELACSPTGLAAISKVSPVDVVAVLFGVWGIKSSFSNYFASYIATFTDVGGNGTEQAAAYFQGASGLIIDFGTSKSAKIESLPSAVYSFGRHGSLSSRLRRKLRILLRHLAPVCLYGVKI